MALFRGVKPVFFDTSESKRGHITSDVVTTLKDAGLVSVGDTVVLTYGDAMETIGASNTSKIVIID